MQHIPSVISNALSEIESSRRPLSLKCLIAKDPTFPKWTLVVSGKWLSELGLPGYELLTREVIAKLDEDSLSEMDGVAVIDERSPMWAILQQQQNKAVGNPTLFGETIETHSPIAPLVIPIASNDRAFA